jgi:hypothetical protein
MAGPGGNARVLCKAGAPRDFFKVNFEDRVLTSLFSVL